MTIQFSRDGLARFASNSFVDGSPRASETIEKCVDSCAAWAEQILRTSPVLADIDFQEPTGMETAISRVMSIGRSLEFTAFSLLAAADFVRATLSAEDVRAAANAGYWLAQIRSMLVFEKRFLDETFRGHESRAQFHRALDFWNHSRASDEQSWQVFLTERPWLLSILTASPVVLISDRAYVGGKTVENVGGSIVDYLVRNQLTGNTTLVEIKTPETLLLGSEYRNEVFAPSAELAGAVLQASTYRQRLVQHLNSLHGDGVPSFSAWNPAAVVIAGDTSTLDSIAKRRSFELYRSELRHVRVVAYDELFASVTALSHALGLTDPASGS